MFATASVVLNPDSIYALIAALAIIAGAVWRAGSKVGRLTQVLDNHDERLDRLESHEDSRLINYRKTKEA